jgi:glycosyltransferase involved in cell wall biosynthesis
MVQQPLISVIVPVYNAAQLLRQCLEAIRKSSYPSYEIIVVDDASTDNSAEIARGYGATVFQLARQSGPAAARNYGAKKATGDILLFIDSDVLIKKETLATVVEDFVENPDIAAVFGSYDDDPAEKNFLSQYKNLLHHYVHQQSKNEAVTFWSGCGAIRKDVFHSVGAFDEKKYSRPCIEDIELGYRLKRKGYRILLDKDLQVKHLKEWRLKSVLRTDIFSRAVPWTKLILESKGMVNDLNLQTSQKISASLVALLVLLVPLTFYMPEIIYGIIFLLLTIFAINKNFFIFLFQRKGLIFIFPAFIVHLFYYFYSGLTFVMCWGLYKIRSEMKL